MKSTIALLIFSTLLLAKYPSQPHPLLASDDYQPSRGHPLLVAADEAGSSQQYHHRRGHPLLEAAEQAQSFQHNRHRRGHPLLEAADAVQEGRHYHRSGEHPLLAAANARDLHPRRGHPLLEAAEDAKRKQDNDPKNIDSIQNMILMNDIIGSAQENNQQPSTSKHGPHHQDYGSVYNHHPTHDYGSTFHPHNMMPTFHQGGFNF